MEKSVLAIVAHPDDAEFLCAGTLALLHKKEWEIHIATMTAGDCGSKSLSRAEISEIRKKEASRATAILDGTYYCLNQDDLFIFYDRKSILKVIELIRKVHPAMVFTMSPDCYLVDHEETSRLAQTACFGAGLVNVVTPGWEPLDYIPHLYYLEPMEGKDKFGRKISATTIVDISSVMDTKKEMLSCHESQREWLRAHHGMDEYVESMQRQSARTGSEVSVKYAEGFRQHQGHAYPQNNLLLTELSEYTHFHSADNS